MPHISPWQDMDAAKLALSKVVLLHLMQDHWYQAGEEILKFERDVGPVMSGSILEGIKAQGGVSIDYTPLAIIVDIVRRAEKIGIPQLQKRGISRFFVQKLLDWYDAGKVSRRDFILILQARQLRFNMKGVLPLNTESELEEAIRIARTCEPFILSA